MQELDKNELEIIKQLVKNPRISDNKISKNTKIPVKTVNRKRKKLEETGIMNYYLSIITRKDGLGWFASRHMYTIKFRLGLSQNKLIREIKEEMNVRTIFTYIIYESHIAEIDGHTGLVLILEGSSDEDVNIAFNSKIVPSLEKNHGKDCIVNISTIRLSREIRLFHNYLPMVNINEGFIKKNWKQALFPSKTPST